MDRFGPYCVCGECGRGGMSIVYKAIHGSLRTTHAIKVFSVSSGSNADFLRRKFVAEARLLATLRHPNIVRVTDYSVTEDGSPWLAMDFVDGTTLYQNVPGANGFGLCGASCGTVVVANATHVPQENPNWPDPPAPSTAIVTRWRGWGVRRAVG